MEKGLEFTSIKLFRQPMKEWCLLNGRNVKIKPNDSKRYEVKCMAKHCQSLYFISKVGGSETYRLKTLITKHMCVRTMKGKLA